MTVSALLPGATDSDFHKNAGMDNTSFKTMVKNDKVQVAAQGIEAMMNDVDHVIGGDEMTRLTAIANRVIPEVEKARLHAEKARPQDGGQA